MTKPYQGCNQQLFLTSSQSSLDGLATRKQRVAVTTDAVRLAAERAAFVVLGTTNATARRHAVAQAFARRLASMSKAGFANQGRRLRGRDVSNTLAAFATFESHFSVSFLCIALNAFALIPLAV